MVWLRSMKWLITVLSHGGALSGMNAMKVYAKLKGLWQVVLLLIPF